jgi:hypothetical protein
MIYNLKGSVTAIKVGADDEELKKFLKDTETHKSDDTAITIVRLDNEVTVRRGYYLVREKDGELHSMKPAEFDKKYEAELVGRSAEPPAPQPAPPVAEGEDKSS